MNNHFQHHHQARLTNARWEAFAMARANGESLKSAYGIAFGRDKANAPHGHRLSQRPEVAGRIEFLKTQYDTSSVKGIAVMDEGSNLKELGITAASIAAMYRAVAVKAREYAALESTSDGNRKKAQEAAIHALGKISELMRMEEKMAASNAKSLPSESGKPSIDLGKLSSSFEKIIEASRKPEPVE